MGKALRDWYFTVQVALSPAKVEGNTGAEQTFTVKGLRTTDQILSVTKPTVQTGLFIANARVSAADTLALQIVNATTASITAAAGETYTITGLRPERINYPSIVNSD